MSSDSKLRIVVTGQIGQIPLGGVAWFHLHYVLGLVRLGHDVFYIEDTGQWPYDPRTRGLGQDCAHNVDYLQGAMSRFGMADRWAYRFPWQSQWYGMDERRRKDVIDSADLMVNVCGTVERPQDYRSIGRLAYLDTDPVFTQIKLARGQADFQKIVAAHDVHFTFGEREQSWMPETGFRWLPTRFPVVLSEWTVSPENREVFTTVMNWTSHNSVEYQGQIFGQKDVEFRRFMDLPGQVAPAVIELAIAPGHGSRTPYDLLRHKGWRLVDPDEVCPDLDSYREYTRRSKAEWSIAKNGYVRGQSGWFSERSARYLASGRPVVAQETGYSSVLPVGEGLLPFSSPEEAVAAIQEVEAGYDRHCRAARAIAEEYFDSDRVLARLVDDAMNAVVT